MAKAASILRRSGCEGRMPHLGHGKHLCYLTNLGFQLSNPKEYKALVKGGKFYCKTCGRVAAGGKSLCKSAKL